MGILHILYIEDNETDAELVIRHIRKSGLMVEYERVETCDEVIHSIQNKEFDLILCDHKLPQFDSFAALELIKEKGFDIPFIVVSGTIGEEKAVLLMKAGANDYVMKDSLKRLVPSIQRELKEAENRRLKKQAEEDLKKSYEIVFNQHKKLLNFSYIVSHNLRSHVSNFLGILDYIEVITLEKEKQEMMDKLKKVATQLDTTLFYLNEIIQIQKNVHIQKTTLAVKNIIDSLFLTFQNLLSSKKGTIKNQIDEFLNIEYNQEFLESILYNLISNSIQYSCPSRPLEIEISNCIENDRVVIMVKDNGLGIDLKLYGDKIFGMFKTFHNNPDAKGLGLFLIKNQVEAMGGQIIVESELNKGTTFKIYI